MQEDTNLVFHEVLALSRTLNEKGLIRRAVVITLVEVKVLEVVDGVNVLMEETSVDSGEVTISQTNQGMKI